MCDGKEIILSWAKRPIRCKGDSFPMGWCEKRIVNGDEDNVWVKYTVLKQNNGSVNLKPEE